MFDEIDEIRSVLEKVQRVDVWKLESSLQALRGARGDGLEKRSARSET